MSTKPNPIPKGYQTITPSLNIKGAADAIEFYKRAFDAVELFRRTTPDGSIMHAELMFGDSHLILNDPIPGWGCHPPAGVGTSPMLLRLYVPDVDTLFPQAIAAGAIEVRPLRDMPWGDRGGTLNDPFGYRWSLATHVEDVAPEEMERRMADWQRQAK
jgi:PhnB protein